MPVLTCATTTILTADEKAYPRDSNYTVLSSPYEASAQDNLGVHVFSCLPLNSGQAFPVGATNVTCTAVVTIGNSATCILQIIVVDSTIPIAECPNQLRISSNDVSNYANWSALNYSDNVRVASTILSVILGQGVNQTKDYISNDANAGSFRIVGNPKSVTFIFEVTDTQGNINSCSWLVTIYSSIISDVDPPTIINCPVGARLSSNPASEPSTTYADYGTRYSPPPIFILSIASQGLKVSHPFTSEYIETYHSTTVTGYGLVQWPNMRGTAEFLILALTFNPISLLCRSRIR